MDRFICMHQSKAQSTRNNNGRIVEKYILSLKKSYSRDSDKRIFDLLVYFKYYLPDGEFKKMMSEFQKMLSNLQNGILKNAFENIRGQMGIKDLSDLEALKKLPKAVIEYNKFDTF